MCINWIQLNLTVQVLLRFFFYSMHILPKGVNYTDASNPRPHDETPAAWELQREMPGPNDKRP